jgi:hypothetical protein
LGRAIRKFFIKSGLGRSKPYPAAGRATGIEVVTPDNAEAGFRTRNAGLDAHKRRP